MPARFSLPDSRFMAGVSCLWFPTASDAWCDWSAATHRAIVPSKRANIRALKASGLAASSPVNYFYATI